MRVSTTKMKLFIYDRVVVPSLYSHKKCKLIIPCVIRVKYISFVLCRKEEGVEMRVVITEKAKTDEISVLSLLSPYL